MTPMTPMTSKTQQMAVRNGLKAEAPIAGVSGVSLKQHVAAILTRHMGNKTPKVRRVGSTRVVPRGRSRP